MNNIKSNLLESFKGQPSVNSRRQNNNLSKKMNISHDDLSQFKIIKVHKAVNFLFPFSESEITSFQISQHKIQIKIKSSLLMIQSC